MIQKLGNKLQVQLQSEEGKKRNINFANVIDDPAEEKVLLLGEIMANLAVEHDLDSVVWTQQSRISK
ncbi:DUF1659 domain-containing protein [Enterococcus hermanniensis]|uniref:DUF1659 domain-containing protein n=1 Tax=Enterococcus hermanniensis TaxID=249189 RepID=A0A1L8TRW1_9ENTE|nr:hypothetical protein [Enterococcus hermanniensis]OJG47066.1 hypothetical protein RV04_GL000313 [Enterococcus hermanniensis]